MSNNKPLEIRINSDNSVHVEDSFGIEFCVAPHMGILLCPGMTGFVEQRLMVDLEDFLQRRYPDEKIATQPIVLKVAPDAKYQRLLAVLYTLHKLGVKTAAFGFYLED